MLDEQLTLLIRRFAIPKQQSFRAPVIEPKGCPIQQCKKGEKDNNYRHNLCGLH
jgi:hypothetical protein